MGTPQFSRKSHYQERKRKMLYIYTAFLLMISISILLMPFGDVVQERKRVVLYISGLLFWLGLIGTITTALYINHSRRTSFKFNKMYSQTKQFGLTHFFQNKAAAIADASMIVGIIGLVISRVFTDFIILVFLFLSVFVFSFGMHCMLNGINYIYINYNIRRS